MGKIIKNLRIYRLIAWILAITMLAGYVPQGVHLKSFNSLKDMGKVQAETTLQNPRIVKDSSMDAGQKVTWDCVWFGSYPQSEVTAEDGAIYTKLKKKAEWECPHCGNRNQDTLNVARRTCGYIGTQFWNQGRTQEIKERVLHL